MAIRMDKEEKLPTEDQGRIHRLRELRAGWHASHPDIQLTL
jgi:hypothetical protein